jgi:hypothetical protein
MKHFRGFQWATLTLGWGLVTLGGCASSQPPPAQAPQWVQVSVLGALPMTDPVAQQACPVPADPAGRAEKAADTPETDASAAITTQGFCVSYLFNNQSFSVWLPNDPGDHLTLQWPMPNDPSLVPLAPGGVMVPYAYPYPYPYVYGGVFWGGVYYRPRPHVMPSSHGMGASGPRGRGGRGHR